MSAVNGNRWLVAMELVSTLTACHLNFYLGDLSQHFSLMTT